EGLRLRGFKEKETEGVPDPRPMMMRAQHSLKSVLLPKGLAKDLRGRRMHWRHQNAAQEPHQPQEPRAQEEDPPAGSLTLSSTRGTTDSSSWDRVRVRDRDRVRGDVGVPVSPRAGTPLLYGDRIRLWARSPYLDMVEGQGQGQGQGQAQGQGQGQGQGTSTSSTSSNQSQQRPLPPPPLPPEASSLPSLKGISGKTSLVKASSGITPSGITPSGITSIGITSSVSTVSSMSTSTPVPSLPPSTIMTEVDNNSNNNSGNSNNSGSSSSSSSSNYVAKNGKAEVEESSSRLGLGLGLGSMGCTYSSSYDGYSSSASSIFGGSFSSSYGGSYNRRGGYLGIHGKEHSVQRMLMRRRALAV
ncbi:unnamed protein product, partial [Discosporangium mesarthrocarpum]